MVEPVDRIVVFLCVLMVSLPCEIFLISRY
jgi:hypothetical protein